MQIDDVMALVDEYVSASIEDHGYRSGAASAEYLEDTKRKLLAAIAALIAAPAAPQQAGQFDHLAGRGMHELRFDELTPYVLSLLAGRGQDTPDVRIAIDWIVSELKRKTNDERALAVKLDAIRAAPQQAEPVAWMAFGGALVHAVTRNAMDPIEAERFDVPLYLHPPAAPQQAEPALNERVGLAYKNGYEEALNDCIRNGGEAWARSMFANGGEHIKPQQAEPVAWAVFDPSGEAIYASLAKTRCVEYVDNEYRYGRGAAKHWAVRPVFAHPPAAEVQRLRDAAQSALEGGE